MILQSFGSWETKADQIISTGMAWLGTPYKFGAVPGQTNNFDCSSYTQYVYGRHGIRLPRLSRQQSQVGIPVSLTNLRKGDLLFFIIDSRKHLPGIQKIGHVGFYIGNNRYLNSNTSKGVMINILDTGRRRGFCSARRVIFNSAF